MKAIIGNIILKDSIIKNGIVIFEKEIKHIMSLEEFKAFKSYNPNIEIIDAQDKYISPGFIDVHIHGCGGCDTMDGTEEAIKTISETVSKYGVTSFLPTTMTMSFESIYTSLEVIKRYMKTKYKGAKILGVHIEGPFINKKYKGAQNAEYITYPKRDLLEQYFDVIKIITYAPEVDEDNSFLNSMKSNEDIILSVGHSNASFEEAYDAIHNGASHFTHTFNAMTPLNHRKPGVVGAALKSNSYIELIADTIHVHPAVFDILISTKSVHKILLITDSMRAGGMCEGEYELGGQKVIVKDGSARLEDGTLAGSILTLNKAVKNMYDNSNIPLYDVIKMVSLNQAIELGIDDSKGSIDLGKDADITVFDRYFNVYLTIVEGQKIYEGGGQYENYSCR